MNELQRLYYTAQAVGWENLPRRVWQVVKSRTGIDRRMLPGGELPPDRLRRHFVAGYQPADARRHWEARAARFFFTAQSKAVLADRLRDLIDDQTWSRRVSQPVQQLRAGRMLLFSRHEVEVGTPPRFNRDPIHGLDWPTPRHWTTYGQFVPGLRDLKCVWEASRFSWAFLLAREHVRRPESNAAELFWSCFDAWDAQNPYGLTPQWACGQEATFRLFAWLLAACAMLDHAATTDARLQRLTQRVWYTARHIEGNINYARSQRNNHAISEAVGLWTVGLLFGELARAAVWRSKGQRILEAELARQVFADGSYVQHSVNYQRVLLDDVLWGVRLGELNGEALSAEARSAVARALRWLLEMVEPASGLAPNYGANDGALVLPLTSCDYTDFRPTTQALHVLLHGTRCWAPGPWDELLLWLGGAQAAAAPLRPFERSAAWAAEVGGYYTMRGPSTWAMTRCGAYRTRPGQADMLHLDLWRGPVNVLRDAGSYFYYCDEPWHSHFYSTAAHNTIEIDHADQMIKGPRFLWFRWTRARRLAFRSSADGRATWFSGEHYGYTRLPGRVVHRRSILRLDDAYVVIDDLLGSGEHDVALRWRLCEADWQTEAGGPAGGADWQAHVDGRRLALALHGIQGLEAALLRGQVQPEPEGWESLYYAEKTPTPVVRLRGRVRLPHRFVSLIACGPPRVRLADDAGVEPQRELALWIDDVEFPLASAREAAGGAVSVELGRPAAGTMLMGQSCATTRSASID